MKKMDSIFVVDDDIITVFGIRKMLSLTVECEEVLSYANGELALNAIKHGLEQNSVIPDVIFLDINMPIMDGWQFLEALIALNLPKKVRINIITSSIDTLDRQTYENYKKRTDHTLSYSYKPINHARIKEITEKA